MGKLSFIVYSDFLANYLAKGATSVRLSTIHMANQEISINGTAEHKALANRVRECLHELPQHQEFDLSIWGYYDNEIIKISRKLNSLYGHNIEWYELINQIAKMANGMPVVAFEVYFTYTPTTNRKSLFIIV